MKIDFYFLEKAEKTYEDERTKYPKYFDGLKSISELREELDRALSQLGETSKGLESVKEKTGELYCLTDVEINKTNKHYRIFSKPRYCRLMYPKSHFYLDI